MRIKNIELRHHRFELKEPYEIAYQYITHADNLFMQITTDRGLHAYGVAAPEPEITGDSVETVTADFEKIIQPQLIGHEFNNPLEFLTVLDQVLIQRPASLALIDMALYDLASKLSHQPLVKFLGEYHKSVETSMTIGILPTEEVLKKAAEHVQQGFTALKIKGGKNVLQDIETVTKIKEIYQNRIKIIFDANQGYSREDAAKFFAGTQTLELYAVEQPLVKDDYLGLGMLQHTQHTPIMVDESLQTEANLQTVVDTQCAKIINLKLMKVGGIAVAKRLNDAIKAHKLASLVGCMDECGLAIAAALHFALAEPNIPMVDLDSHFGFLHDITSDAVIFNQGHLSVTDRPGIGFDF
ncbi:dipeptide epimerase [bacterium]|nr:dipeptide epimerase [bacterium]